MKSIKIKILFLLISLFIISFVISVLLVKAADTGFNQPSETGEFLNSWTTPSNAFTSNNAFAEDNCNSQIEQDYAVFGFVGISGTIDGIEVTDEGRRGTTLCAIGGLSPSIALSWNDGTTYTVAKEYLEFTLTGSDETRTLGGATDTWGRTWTASEFSNANFKLKVNSGDTDFNQRIDQFLVKVYFTAAAVVVPKRRPTIIIDDVSIRQFLWKLGLWPSKHYVRIGYLKKIYD